MPKLPPYGGFLLALLSLKLGWVRLDASEVVEWVNKVKSCEFKIGTCLQGQ